MTRTVTVKTRHGFVKFHYCISTPTDNDAASIDPKLPTVLFLHPVYIEMKIFHPQFEDPDVRRFNLVTLDFLAHGLTEGKVPAGYGQTDAATDLAAFMDALELPPCIVFGVSMGTIIGLQLALSFPHKVFGLFLVSPLGMEEPVDVADGRRQIYDTWREAFQGDKVDSEAVSDAVFGALQLGLNSKRNRLFDALHEILTPQTINNWGPENFDDCEAITVKFIVNRKGYTKDQLAQLGTTQAVVLIHGLADVAYSPEHLADFAKQLKQAGVPTTVHDIEGAPRFSSVTHFTIVNPLLVRFVLDQWTGPPPPPASPNSPIVSPFEADLRKVGWTGYESDDE